MDSNNASNNQKYNLFIIVLGGRLSTSNIEVHDIRWFVGRNIKETFKYIKKEWVGDLSGLHIDSYITIKYIDGYKVELNKINKGYNNQKRINCPKLWFVYLGGYDHRHLIEQHHLDVLVAMNKKEAKSKALNKWKTSLKQMHKDNCHTIDSAKGIDNCLSIEKVKNWQIELRKDCKNRSQKIVPDWQGYLRLDN